MIIKTDSKAGMQMLNHASTLVATTRQGLRVKTSLKAGGIHLNHNETLHTKPVKKTGKSATALATGLALALALHSVALG